MAGLDLANTAKKAPGRHDAKLTATGTLEDCRMYIARPTRLAKLQDVWGWASSSHELDVLRGRVKT